MDRRTFIKRMAAAGTAAGTAPSLFLAACGDGAAGKGDATLRIIQTPNMTSLDPIWTTSPGTRDLGFLVFDQLVASDAKFEPQPQMASWTIEDDGKSYVFTLRERLKFHDGAPVRPADCIASIKRWAARDGFGGILIQSVDTIEPIDDHAFRIRLKQPFPLLLRALGKTSAPSCLIMPERLARTDPSKQVTEAIGSGPYRFLKDEWVPGSHAAFARFDDYVPRNEPTSGMAGSRRAGAARLELTQIGDASTAMAALQAGEQDVWDAPPSDLIATLRADPNITVEPRFVLPGSYMLQFNHLQPPFNNLKVRQALAMALDQRQTLRTAVADPTQLLPCYSYFACGTPYGNEDGSALLRTADPARAKAALAASGYTREKVVLLCAAEGPLAGVGATLEDLMRRIGFNLQLVTLDFASITQRRTNRNGVDHGGWSAFTTGWLGTDLLDPGSHPMLRGAGEKGYWGWADDPVIEQLRTEWTLAATPAEQRRIARELQIQACRTLPYLPLGSVVVPTAHRKNVTGVSKMPASAYFNIGKNA